MSVMSETLLGKNPSQTVSQINLSLDTTLTACFADLFSWGWRGTSQKRFYTSI